MKVEGPVISPANAPQPVASGHGAPAPRPSNEKIGSSRIKERVNVGVCLILIFFLGYSCKFDCFMRLKILC